MISVRGYAAIIGLSLVGASVAIVYHQAIPAFIFGWIFGEALNLLMRKIQV